MAKSKQAKVAKKKPAKTQIDRGISGADLGLDCDISKQRVSQLEAEGVFSRNASGRFDRRPNVIRYIRRVRDEGRESARSPEAKRLLEAKARAIELRNAKLENLLIEVSDVALFVQEMFGAWASELIGVPAAATRDLALREDIERALGAANERANAKVLKLGEDLAAGKGILFDDDAED